MHYLEILGRIADALFPLAMLVNGFCCGFAVNDLLHERAKERRKKQKDNPE